MEGLDLIGGEHFRLCQVHEYVSARYVCVFYFSFHTLMLEDL